LREVMTESTSTGSVKDDMVKVQSEH
jgi:hypothetical protein